MSLAKRMELRKGDYIMEEGDLYQRVYTILSGEVHAVRGGVTYGMMHEGEVIGYAFVFVSNLTFTSPLPPLPLPSLFSYPVRRLPTLLHLRPCPTSLVIASDTATVLMVPAHKMIEISRDNTPLAARLYKRAATKLQSQIEGVLRRTREVGPVLSVSLGYTPETSVPVQRQRDSFSAESASSSSSSSSLTSSPRASPAHLKAPLSPALFV